MPLAAASLAACSPNYNPLVVTRDTNFHEVVSDGNPFSIITTQDEATFNGDQLRNFKVLRAMAIEDESFREYLLKVWTTDATTVSGLDIATLGLTAASSLTGGALAKALAATATAVTGTRTSLDKNFFYGKTIDALLYSMVTTRAKIRDHIQTCLKLSSARYDLPTALYDVEQYREAGRIQFAIANVAVSSTGTISSASQDCTNQATPEAPTPAPLAPRPVASPGANVAIPPAPRLPQRQPGVSGAVEAARLQAFVNAGVDGRERGRRLDLIRQEAVAAGFPDTKSGDSVIEDTGPAADERRRRVLERLSLAKPAS